MGVYLVGGAAADAGVLGGMPALARGASLSIPHARLTALGPPASHSQAVSISLELRPGLKSLLALAVVADLVLYAAGLLQLPGASTHIKVTPSGAAVSWVAIPQYLLAWIAISAVAPALALASFRALLDRRERRLADELERVARRKRGPFDVLMPPRNWAIFPADAPALLWGAGLLFALNCIVWLAWLGQPGLIGPLVLPYLTVMLGALTVILGRGWMLRAASERLDTLAMLRLNRMQLASRVSYFFAFPLVFYALISIGQGMSYALALKPGIPTSLPIVSGNSMRISGMAITSVGEPQLQTQAQFDRFLATRILAPSSLDLALVGAVAAAIVMYLGVFRYWTLLGIYRAAGEFPLERGRPPGVSRIPATGGGLAILAQWAFMLVTNLLGAAVIIVTALWVTHHYIYGPVLERFIVFPMSAFVWYKTVIAIRLGQAVATGLLVLLIIPGVLSLVIWAYSIAARICLAVRLLLPGRRDIAARVRAIEPELRQIAGRRLPRIRVEKRLDFPRTEALLPFRWACVIRIPQHCLQNLDDAPLISVIAHEIVHARKHARRLWWLEFFSWLTITGPGLLTLLLDFTAMEFQADEAALRWTEDRRAAVKALEYFEASEWDARPEGSGAGRFAAAKRHVASSAVTRFRAVFFTFWTAQPGEEAVSFQERARRIAGYST